MHPDSRSISRFFQGLAEVCPVGQLEHFHLIHWPIEPPSPLDPLREAGFRGRVVVARASLADAIRREHPGVDLVLDDHPTAGAMAGHLLMELPQGREASRLAIDAALAALRDEESRLWLFGNRESGILSVSKGYDGVETVLCKGHLRLLSLSRGSRLRSEKTVLRSFAPGADGFASLEAAGLRVALRPGIFSWQAIDPATLLLLEAIREQPGRRLLDWGCGSGFLGAALARRFPDLRVVLSDDLVTATHCARRTVEWNGLAERCEVITEDGIGRNLERMRFDAIVTNPPAHRGVRSNHDATLTFLASAAGVLHPGGVLWLVGSRGLDYGTLMRSRFGQVEERDGDDAFTVWRGVKTREKRVSGSGGRVRDGQWLEADGADPAFRDRLNAWGRGS
ncbi:MAG: methyltransferase [Magnetococcales bacterium]|nr:methyltransferase [Magnetococcales bacterium]